MADKKTDDTEPRLLKDRLNREKIEILAAGIRDVHPKFNTLAFVKSVLADPFEQLELRDKVLHAAEKLRSFLPDNYEQATDILIKAGANVGGWGVWITTSFVELFGLDHFDVSVRAMKELTPYSSSEFAIRPFMIKYTDRMLPILHEWAGDSNEHVRRLAAEGSRPRGVWVAHIEQFKNNPKPVLELLDKLKTDPSLYVRKAVANSLNDISKDHPDLVIRTALAWQANGNPDTRWIVRHACRTMIKKGDPRVFPLLGLTAKPDISVDVLKVSRKKVKIGSDFLISFDISSKSKKTQKLAIDYRLHYLKASGKMSPKVFKLAEKTLKPGETLSLSKKHSFAEQSTRKHYPGHHCLELIVNGIEQGKLDFQLTN